MAHIDQRERDLISTMRQEQLQDAQLQLQQQQQQLQQTNQSKTEEIVLLEKQGRCSQKIRNNSATTTTTAMGNLAQVTQTVGQNMTDISNIGSGGSSVGCNITSKVIYVYY